MKFMRTEIEDVVVIDIEPIQDDRGFFSRGWCAKEFGAHGLKTNIVQQNIGFSVKKGTLRGMHFQTAPHQEAKIVRCVRGGIYDVAVDLRPESKTFGKWVGVELSADNHRILYVPEGFAHGYQTLEDNTEMHYFTTELYAPKHATGIRFDDPAIGITWPLEVTELSNNDQNWPYLTI